MNTVLQGLINPATPEKGELVRGNRVLRVSDRVIPQVKDYKREVFNGDLGIAAEVDNEDQAVIVQYGESWSPMI